MTESKLTEYDKKVAQLKYDEKYKGKEFFSQLYELKQNGNSKIKNFLEKDDKEIFENLLIEKTFATKISSF